MSTVSAASASPAARTTSPVWAFSETTGDPKRVSTPFAASSSALANASRSSEKSSSKRLLLSGGRS
jgi:hypothetical protein